MVDQTTAQFYDALAEHYHLIFEDWDKSIERQRGILDPILREAAGRDSLKILDCACGIGTQAIGVAQSGHRVAACDVSTAAVARARREASLRSVDIEFRVADMCSLACIESTDFDVVAAMDNALPHLSADELARAARVLHLRLRPGGVLIASLRDYDRLILEKPAIQPPAFYRNERGRWFVHQVWDWVDDTGYVLHLYITTHFDRVWASHHFAGKYRCLLGPGWPLHSKPPVLRMCAGSCLKKAATTSQSCWLPSYKTAPSGGATGQAPANDNVQCDGPAPSRPESQCASCEANSSR